MKKNVKILGTGCPKCITLYNIVDAVVKENNINASITKVEDIMEIMTYDVMTTPALVIDNKVLVKGRVPSKTEVLELLQDKTNLSEASSGGCCCS